MNRMQVNRDHLVMIPLMLGISLSPLNVVLTSVALPTMRDAFAVNIVSATWIGTAYFIPSVAFMPLQGYLGGRWGMRRVYAAGMLLLAAGALLERADPQFSLAAGWAACCRASAGPRCIRWPWS